MRPTGAAEAPAPTVSPHGGDAEAGPAGADALSSAASAGAAPARAPAPDSAFAASLAASALAPPPPPAPPPDAAAPAAAPPGTAQLAAADVETGELWRCRVCLGGEEDGPLTTLHCACRGELAVIHEACAKRWFQRRRSGVCELCRTPAFDLPPEDLVVHLTARQAESLARRAAGGMYPELRKALMLGLIAVTLGLILAGALGWMVPSLHCRHANVPAGVLPIAFFIAVFHRRVFVLVPRSIRESWHALGLLASVCLLVDVSVLMTGSGSWC